MSIGGVPPKGPGSSHNVPDPKKSSSAEGRQRGRKLTSRSSQKERWLRDAKSSKDSRHFSSYDTEVVDPDEVDPQLSLSSSGSDDSSRTDKRGRLPGDKLRHQSSVDSGFGTLASYSSHNLDMDDIDEEDLDAVFENDTPELTDQNRKLIEQGLKDIADELYHLGAYDVSQLKRATNAFQGWSSQKLGTALESVGLSYHWDVVRNSAVELLEWSGKGETLELPGSLIKAAKKKESLDVEAGQAFSQAIDAEGTLKRVYYRNKAIRLRKSSNEHVKGDYTKEFKGYQAALKEYISDQQASIQMHENYDELKGSLYERYGLSSHTGIVSIVEKEWVRNILMRRAVEASSIAGTGLL
ncbi:hypothetical protein [Endozoicomonas arenosclerae]|uniref:hypothetical protein n=1 Tax=Endozoicomonas arenosclerae TaxID=1633495 RepID=UPI000785C0CF|nr:hypothetical protein [Endozoicomonas arenosclerae]